jgi:Fibronectin type III domain
LAGPINVTVTHQPNGSILIGWQPNTVNSRLKPVHYYSIQYRTVARWVPLASRIPPDRTSFMWTTASRGATYHFRVVGHYGADEQSEPSAAVSVYTGGERRCCL